MSSLLLVGGGVTIVLGRLPVRLRLVAPPVLVEHPGYELRRLGLPDSRMLVRLLGMLMGPRASPVRRLAAVIETVLAPIFADRSAP